MKYIFFTLILLSICFSSTAQRVQIADNNHEHHQEREGQYETKEFKIKQSSGNLYIKGVADVTIESYNGNEIIVSGEVMVKKDPENDRSKGLKVLDSRGIEDNTGLGYSLIQKEGNVEMTTLGHAHCDCIPITIKVPQGVGLIVEDNTFRGQNIVIKNFTSPIDVSMNNHNITLENITGPMAVKTLHGNIESVFNTISQEGTINLVAVHGFVDVSLPSSTRADLKLKTQHGEIYTDMDIEISKSDENTSDFGNKVVVGKLNGGGVSMTISSNFHEVYLRKI